MVNNSPVNYIDAIGSLRIPRIPIISDIRIPLPQMPKIPDIQIPKLPRINLPKLPSFSELKKDAINKFLTSQKDICKCEEWVKNNSTQEALHWTKSLPKCPCILDISGAKPTLPDYADNSKWKEIKPAPESHPGATYEIRSNKVASGGAQQCEYDVQGKLITDGAGAGTPDKAAHEWPGAKHGWVDLRPWMWCGGDESAWEMYNKARPPDSGVDAFGNECPYNKIP